MVYCSIFSVGQILQNMRLWIIIAIRKESCSLRKGDLWFFKWRALLSWAACCLCRMYKVTPFLAWSQESYLKSAWPGKCVFFWDSPVETKPSLLLLLLTEKKKKKEKSLFNSYLESFPSEMGNLLILIVNI